MAQNKLTFKFKGTVVKLGFSDEELGRIFVETYYSPETDVNNNPPDKMFYVDGEEYGAFLLLEEEQVEITDKDGKTVDYVNFRINGFNK